ncbi:MAG: HD domain-containing protein [Anaerolineales bacterium]|nr:HD domain-containing protein [Anaerolineales bacterium]
MITKDQVLEIGTFVKDYLKESAACSDQEWLKSFPRAAEYRWQHTLNVLANAEKILEGEGASEEQASVVRAAALLHDVSMFTCDHSIHGRVSAEIAEEYLSKHGYPDSFVQKVSKAVAEHGTDLGPIPPDAQGELFSWEGKVLLEADILDKLGASAVTNALLYLGKQGYLSHEVRRDLEDGSTFERAEFFRDYIWTPTGRKIAKERFSFFLEFLARLKEEVVDIEIPMVG